jgi:hypothetical protein
MTEALASPLLQRGLSRLPASGATAPKHIRTSSALMEARRAGNAELGGFDVELRCECALPNCRETIPAVAELCRGRADRFIVVPAHLGVVVTPANIYDGRVVRAADRFFVVELNRDGGRYPVPVKAGAGLARTHSAWSTTTSRPRKKN